MSDAYVTRGSKDEDSHQLYLEKLKENEEAQL